MGVLLYLFKGGDYIARYRLCGRCGARMKYTDEDCPNKCKTKAKKKHDKYYDKHKRNKKSREFYDSKQWKKLTKLCKRKFKGIDVYAYYKYGKIIPGTLSHHIIELLEDYNRGLDLENLIYISDKSHSEIHKAYEESEEAKKKMQEYLFNMIERFIEEFGS